MGLDERGDRGRIEMTHRDRDALSLRTIQNATGSDDIGDVPARVHACPGRELAEVVSNIAAVSLLESGINGRSDELLDVHSENRLGVRRQPGEGFRQRRNGGLDYITGIERNARYRGGENGQHYRCYNHEFASHHGPDA